MSSGTTRNRALRETALLDAAQKLFATRGYEVTTTREIAAEAGCAEGLIHRYFNGKAGLLLGIIQSRISEEVLDLNQRLPLCPRVDGEIEGLVEWELEHMWEDRDFLRVIIPRAFVDPEVGKILSKIGPPRRAKAICDRLRQYEECGRLPQEELEALANAIEIIGFIFGFLRPLALHQDRTSTKKAALALTRIVTRGLMANASARDIPHRSKLEKDFSLTTISGM